MVHTLLVTVEDKPGVLNRVASLFRRRAFNINSLSVGRTSQPGVSRMTIVLDGADSSATRVVAYLDKLVNVIHVEELGADAGVVRDLALVKLAPTDRQRQMLLRILDETRAHIVDSGQATVTVEITGDPPHVDHVVERLGHLGLVEMVRTGRVAMRRGDPALSR